MSKQNKHKPLIRKGKLTSADIILKSGEKRRYIIHFQRHAKTEKQMDGSVIDLKRNKDKMIFYETEKDDMMFTQLSCYAHTPFQFMIVNGERFIVMPFDKAFALKKGLDDYLEFVKGFRGDNPIEA